MEISEISSFDFIARTYKELFDGFDGVAILAGGAFSSCLARRKIKDLDIFTNDPEKVITWLTDEPRDLQITHNNNFICNLKYKGLTVQVIKSHQFESATATIAEFDYTIVCCAWDGKELTYHDRFFLDNAQLRLVVNALPKPLSTLRRLTKYCGRGYFACPVGLGKLARAINELKIDWDNPQENSIDFYPDGTPTFRGLD